MDFFRNETELTLRNAFKKIYLVFILYIPLIWQSLGASNCYRHRQCPERTDEPDAARALLVNDPRPEPNSGHMRTREARGWFVKSLALKSSLHMIRAAIMNAAEPEAGKVYEGTKVLTIISDSGMK